MRQVAGRSGAVATTWPHRTCSCTDRLTSRRTGTSASIHFGESSMAGEWSSLEPTELLTEFARDRPSPNSRPSQAWRRLHLPGQPRSEREHPRGAAENISFHFDLSNDHFALVWGGTMTHSWALVPYVPRRRGGLSEDRDDRATAAQHPLADAQRPLFPNWSADAVSRRSWGQLCSATSPLLSAPGSRPNSQSMLTWLPPPAIATSAFG